MLKALMTIKVHRGKIKLIGSGKTEKVL